MGFIEIQTAGGNGKRVMQGKIRRQLFRKIRFRRQKRRDPKLGIIEIPVFRIIRIGTVLPEYGVSARIPASRPESRSTHSERFLSFSYSEKSMPPYRYMVSFVIPTPNCASAAMREVGYPPIPE